MDPEEWLATTPYTEARKNELRKVIADMYQAPPSRKQASRISSFGKTESYPVYKLLRWINARPDCVKVWLGPLIKQVEQVVFSRDEFIKHTPVPERPAKLAGLRNAMLRYFLTDFTAYESHFLPEFMKACEIELYRYVLAFLPEEEMRLVEEVLTGTNRLHTRLGVAAIVEGRRMSGDMCTSLGNGFTNLMLMLFVAKLKKATVSGFVEGDDGIFASDVEITEEDYTKLGWTIKLREVNDPCEMIPLSTEGLDTTFGASCGAFCGILCAGSQIIRDPRSFLSTFGWTSSFIHAGPKIMHELLRAKALSACYETPQCPIVGAVARRALKLTRGVNPRWTNDGYHLKPPDELKIEDFEPNPQTRLLFETQFGVSPAAQILAEKRIEQGRTDILDIIGSSFDMLHYEARFVEAS